MQMILNNNYEMTILKSLLKENEVKRQRDKSNRTEQKEMSICIS